MQRVAGALSLIAIVVSLVILTDGPESPVEPEAPLRRSLRADVVGCYSLFTARGRRIDTTFYNASPRVRLDTARRDPRFRDSTHRVMHALDTLGNPSRTTRGSWPAWSADSLSDTVYLSFSTGFSGASFAFAIPGGSRDTFHGRAVEYWDFTRPTNRGRAYAVRTACPQVDSAPASPPRAVVSEFRR
jgi:hypothetical protein